jgi:hypothetical protein
MLSNATKVRAGSARRTLLVFLLLCLPMSLTAGIGAGDGTADSVAPAATAHAPGPPPAGSRALGPGAAENTPARLRAYREAAQRMDRLTRLHALSARLEAMLAPKRSEARPGGGHDAALATARARHAGLSRKVKEAEAARRARLHDLTAGRSLPPGDLAALHRMLGL